MSHRFDPTCLREYDIRGVVGRTLGEADAYAIGRGFATLVRRSGGSRVAVGRDGRDSSLDLERALVRGLNEGGADVDRTDGARVTTSDGWWLLRASNTQDVLVARAEATDEQALERLLAQIDEQLALSGVRRGAQAAH